MLFINYCFLGPIPKANRKAKINKTDIQYQIKCGEVLTNMEYNPSNVGGTTIRRIESITLIAPNNRPI